MDEHHQLFLLQRKDFILQQIKVEGRPLPPCLHLHPHQEYLIVSSSQFYEWTLLIVIPNRKYNICFPKSVP